MDRLQPRITNRVLNLAMALVLAMGMSPLPILSQAAYADESATGTAAAADTSTGGNGATASSTAPDNASTSSSEAADTTDSIDTSSASTTTGALLSVGATALAPQAEETSPYNLWVGGTQVTSENKDNVLAGTENDGKVQFLPGVGSSQLGVLELDGANIEGVENVRRGAGIYATQSLQIVVSGDNYVDGAAFASDSNAGVYANGLTLGGTGSLAITAADCASGKSAWALASADPGGSAVGDLTLQNSVTVTANAGAGTGMGVFAGDITLVDRSSLSGVGGVSVSGTPAVSSTGIACYGAIALSGNSALTGTGSDASDASVGVFCISTRAGSASDIGLTATGGKVTSSNGSSYGLNCAESLVLTSGNILLKSGTSPHVSAASNNAIDVSGYAAYRWRASKTDSWSYSANTPYAFDDSTHYLQITSNIDRLWVQGVRVTADNMDDVLGDGTVTYTPAGTNTTASGSAALAAQSAGDVALTPQSSSDYGTLTLSGASIAGVQNEHNGAGIYSEDPLIVEVEGANVVKGAASSGDAYAISIPGLVLFDGSGTLDVSAGSAGDGNSFGLWTDQFSNDLPGNVFLKGSVELSVNGGESVSSSAGIPYASAGIVASNGSLVATDNAKVTAGSSIGDSANIPHNSFGILTGTVTASGSAHVEGTGAIATNSFGITCAKLDIDGDALVEGHGGQTADADDGVSKGIETEYVTVKSGTLVGTAKSASTSYGININIDALDDTTATPGNTIVITGGTVIGSTDAASGTDAGAFSQAADVSGYNCYKWRASATGDYTYGNYAYSASDTYEEIAPGVAPAPSPAPAPSSAPAPSPSSGSSSATPATGDASGALPYALGMLALLAGGTAAVAQRRRRMQR